MAEVFYDGRLIVKHGDITKEAVDAIVNAANWTLLGGGGVDGAIHAAGGREIYHACKELRETEYPNGLPTGQAVITTGGDLPAKHVIHTVGPIYSRHNGNEPELLADCYRNSVKIAVEHNLSTIAFPSISTGAYGYPKHEAAMVVGTTVRDILTSTDRICITLIFFSPADADGFLKHSGLCQSCLRIRLVLDSNNSSG
jgi:O-acetyl-ADP-ribose deacetylase (regulator of RNase III)